MVITADIALMVEYCCLAIIVTPGTFSIIIACKQ